MKETKDSIKIRHLMEQAERLPKDEAMLVLKAVRSAVAGERSFWTDAVAVYIK